MQTGGEELPNVDSAAGAVGLTFDGSLATITLSQSERRNAISLAIWIEIGDAVERVRLLDETRVLTIRGAGDFSVGADISDFLASRATEAAADEYGRVMEATISAVEKLPIPTIALIEGYCLGGGCDLAMACDLRLASETSQFGVTAAKLGLVFGLESTRRLVDTVGDAQARYLLLTAELVTASNAHRIGLVHATHGPEVIDAAGADLARRLSALASVSHWGAKSVLAVLRMTGDRAQDLHDVFTESHRSREYKEGVSAFLEGRQPDFVSHSTRHRTLHIPPRPAEDKRIESVV